MNPNNFTIVFATADAVVATIPEAFRFCTERRNKATCDEFAIGLSPTHSEVVAAEIIRSCKRICFYALTEVLVNIGSQDGFTQTTRTTVNEDDKLLFTEVERL